ncbi:hypothetical protein D3C75_991220 [compost metagenome]
MFHNPADPVFNCRHFAAVSADKCCNVGGINQAGCNIGAAHQLDSRSLIYLMIGGTVTKESDGGPYKEQHNKDHPS